MIFRWLRRLGLAIAALAALGQPALAQWDSDDWHELDDDWHGSAYVLDFVPTPNLSLEGDVVNGAPAAVDPKPTGRMVVYSANGRSNVRFSVRGVRPNMLYTIWTVFKVLTPGWNTPGPAPDKCPWPTEGPFFPCASMCDVNTATPCGVTVKIPNFYPEANAVAPLARLDAPFTDGMGIDPGGTFITDAFGNGDVSVSLDYDLLGVPDLSSPGKEVLSENGPPVANKAVITQCIPKPPADTDVTNPDAVFPGASSACPGTRQRVTSTWLRKYVAQFVVAGGGGNAGRAKAREKCAQAAADPTASLYWQCIDPATVDPLTGTGLPRVFRYPFDHFRLAAHPDGLTHGFIGGSEDEHVIDMVGRRCQVQPRPGGSEDPLRDLHGFGGPDIDNCDRQNP